MWSYCIFITDCFDCIYCNATVELILHIIKASLLAFTSHIKKMIIRTYCCPAADPLLTY